MWSGIVPEARLRAFANEVIAWLRERGLRLAGVYNMSDDSDGRAVQADFLFGR